MDRVDRKAAIAAYKERKAVAGIFAVICSATGEAWVGQSKHLDTQQNSLWFQLRMGGHRCASLQSAWREHGEAEFRYEALDPIPEDVSALARGDELKKRAAIWTARLHATAL
jgi:hypothetical protein